MSTRYSRGRREGITEELVEALADYENGPFSEREKAALRYADQMYLDHHAHQRMDDLFEGLRQHFTEPEIIELTWAICEFIGLGKLIYVLGVPYGAEAPAGPDGQRRARPPPGG